MSDRQYGISAGYSDNSPPRSRDQVSPIEQYNSMQSHQLQDYGMSQSARSVQRRPVGQSQRQNNNGGTAYSGAPPAHQNTQYESYRSQSSSSPDQDNYGAGAVGGGLTGIASDVADNRPRESGLQAQRDIDTHYGGQRMMDPSYETPYESYDGPRPAMHQPSNSQSSFAPLTANEADIAGHHPSRLQQNGVTGYGSGYDQSMPGGRQPYQGDGYDEFLDPRDIADDGDELEQPQTQRRSRLEGAFAGGAAAGAAMGAFGARDASGNYGAVPGGGTGSGQEKSEWLKRQTGGNKRLKWLVGVGIVVVVIAAAVGTALGVLLSRNGSGGPARGSASDSNGIYDINSSQVQAVLNNKNLHKVFPGMDYTPLNAQYPDCLTNPPYQNDVTLDVAVLAQMTPAIRLYGTDCNQTELVLKGIDLLGYNSTVKVWLGVWLANNATTNTRQLNQMYDILDAYPASHFAGVIVGNEVLFREDMTITQLAAEISTVKSNLAKRGISLPVSTSDLGDDWTAALAADSDIVMSNVHPFFAGVTPAVAPGWVWDFWQTHDVTLKPETESGASYPTNIISETGWPSQGGNDCGTGAKCPTATAGSVAGIDELNEYMAGWVCQSLANSTTYFWFEAFDVSRHPPFSPLRIDRADR